MGKWPRFGLGSYCGKKECLSHFKKMNVLFEVGGNVKYMPAVAVRRLKGCLTSCLCTIAWPSGKGVLWHWQSSLVSRCFFNTRELSWVSSDPVWVAWLAWGFSLGSTGLGCLAHEQESREVALGREGIWLCFHLNARLEVGTDHHFYWNLEVCMGSLYLRWSVCSVTKDATEWNKPKGCACYQGGTCTSFTSRGGWM